MKTSKWIKLIGILCILFGINGLINNYVPIQVPDLIEKGEVPSNIPNWHLILAYIGVIVSVIYLLAGIFFILKKSFSINLMYSALTISIIYVVVPLLVVKPYHSILFVLISPLIDLILLIGVYRIRKYYYSSPNEIIKLLGEYTLLPQFLKLFTLLGLIFIFIPISILGLWIYSSNTGTDQAERVEIFNNYIPEFLHGSTNYLGLVFCTLAIIFSGICLNSSGKSYGILNKIIPSISILLLLLNLFQLM